MSHQTVSKGIQTSQSCPQRPDLGPVRVAPVALVKAEREVLLHRRKTCRALLKLGRNVGGLRAGEDVEIHASTKSAPGNIRGLEQDFLAMGIPIV